MTRFLRLAGAVAIAALLAACDKCGDWKPLILGDPPVLACSSDKPQG